MQPDAALQLQYCTVPSTYRTFVTLLGKSETYKETIKGTFHHYPYGTVPYLSCHYYGTNNPYSYRELIITCLVAGGMGLDMGPGRSGIWDY